MGVEEKTNPKSGSGQEGLREKITLAVVGFVLTGLLGGVLTTWIQQRGWAWQNRVATIEKDVNNVVSTYKAASELLNSRWHASYRLVRGLERDESNAAWASARTDFEAADREWALHYANVARDVEFYVDAPFGIGSSDDLKKVWSTVCDGASRRLVDTESARVLLELVNHCQQQLKSALEALTDPPPDAKPIEPKLRKAVIDQSYRRLDQLYRANDVLRCVMFDRATSIRSAQSSQSYWSAFFGIERPTYLAARKAADCT